MKRNSITINQFIEKNLGEWKSLRSTHSLAFQEVENSNSKILIKSISNTNKKVIELLEKYSFKENTDSVGISISWQTISDWDENQNFERGQNIMLFLPLKYNSGIVLRNKGYTEKTISSSKYLIDENQNLNLKTIYSSTVSEERICFLSTHIRSRYSVIRNQENNAVIQTSHTSEVRCLSNLKD